VPPTTPSSDPDQPWLDRLQRNLDAPGTAASGSDSDESSEADRINYAQVETELLRMKKKLAIWEIFARYMRDGADSWSQVQRALSPEDLNEIVRICDGVPLRDVLLDSDH
jgi:hypothetical protein